jgi:hypothetical protein
MYCISLCTRIKPSRASIFSWGGVLRPLFGVFYLPWMMADECRALSGIFGKGNWCARRKPAPVSLCPPQIPMTWPQTQATAVWSRQLTTWATAWPQSLYLVIELLTATWSVQFAHGLRPQSFFFFTSLVTCMECYFETTRKSVYREDAHIFFMLCCAVW